MGTEDISRRYRGIETWPDPEVLETLVEAQLSGVAAVRAALTALASAAEAAVARLRRGGRLVYAGAGTSIRLGVQDGVELTPTYGWLADRTVFLVAGGYDALTKAIEGAEDDRAAGAAAARSEDLGKLDVTIAISASGQTPYTLGAVEEARNLGALTIGIACNPDAPLLTSVEHRVLIDTGPESIAGSTRLKAGTAQKVTLNLLSTLIMIRLGRVFDGLMVDVVATNAKLRTRTVTMLSQITGVNEASAQAALASANGQLKLAVMIATGLPPEAGQRLLDEHDGDLTRALKSTRA